MANKPADLPEWASTDITELKVIDGTPVNLLNKVEPPAEWKLSGELYQENLPRAYINYQFDLLDSWITNIDERTSKVGVIHLTTDSGQTEVDLGNRFGGTWTARGTQAIGTAATVYVFERTA